MDIDDDFVDFCISPRNKIKYTPDNSSAKAKKNVLLKLIWVQMENVWRKGMNTKYYLFV